MSRKRSLKDRYWRFLRRIWPAPTLAALTLSLGSCASQPMASATARAQATPAATVATQGIPTSDELRYPWNPRMLPTELHLAPEFRSACTPIVSLPPSLELDENEKVVDALEPIASCLTLGPLSHGRLHLLGESGLPGRWQAPIEGNGRADQLRSTLSLLGVPFENLVTHDIDNGNHVELGLEPGSS